MEPARPRADQNFFGPRAGRLQRVNPVSFVRSDRWTPP
jgi:hypothetical protein